MTIDKPLPSEPKIPDLPLGVSSQEILGDPCGGDGGGGGKRMGDWSGGRTSRRIEERRMLRVESRSNERLEPTIPGLSSGETGDPRGAGGGISGRFDGVNRLSVAWRRKRDSHWRMTGIWLDSIEPQESPSSSGGLRVAKPVAKEESPELPWRPWEADRPGSANKDQGLSQVVSQLQSNVGVSHKENVGRFVPLDDCPSSNLHHFVQPIPHTSHEVYPSLDIRTKKSVIKGRKQIN